jgi:hypothetical protein
MRVGRKKAQEAKKNPNPSYGAADGFFLLQPPFANSFPIYVLLRLLRLFAAKKDKPVRNSRSRIPAQRTEPGLLNHLHGAIGEPDDVSAA